MTAATLIKKPQNTARQRHKNVACFKNVDTNQLWLVKFDREGNIDSSCHIGRGTDLDNLAFDSEYNDLLDSEAAKLELVPLDYKLEHLIG